MSISAAISNAYSGLTSVSRMAEITSNNVANAMNENYARREVVTSQQVLAGTGMGVNVSSINRALDLYATSSRRARGAEYGNASVLSEASTRMAKTLGVPGDAGALGTRMLNFENALRTAADNPASGSAREQVLAEADSLIGTLKNISTQTMAVRMDADASIATQVRDVNVALKKIESVNMEIRLRQGSGDTAALEDVRKKLIDEVSSVIPIKQISRDGGIVALYTEGGAALIDGQAGELGFSATPVITPDMTLASGALSGLTLNGRPMSIGTGAGQLEGGTLSAAFEVRDIKTPEFNARIDAVALDVLERFQSPATDPTLVAGDAGLFTDNGAAFTPGDELALAQRLQINTAVDPAQGGDLWRLRDGINALAQGPAGDDSQLRRMVDAMLAERTPSAATGLISLSSATELAEGISALVAAQAVRAEDTTAYNAGQFDILRESELSITGVDTDYEMQQLIMIEQAYAANARVISTADQLMQTLLEI
ncbi:MAG: flagellar hook-associated protein FlgK [Rhodobacteraceae bacterium]|nr:flagellar hook-associated protein FlgK [Paracoccaceae bacterium]